MRVIVTGASGLIGSALERALQYAGHEVVRVGRRASLNTGKQRELIWDFESPIGWEQELRTADAVVHLAGANIASSRWTEERKRLIRMSRIRSTRLLAEALIRFKETGVPCPKIFLVASATGFYGDRGDAWLNERSGKGEGFLPDLCAEWESSALCASNVGIRTVCARFGIVLSMRGGALAAMVPMFRLGLGGKLGCGRQYWSWIGIEDAVFGMIHSLLHDQVSGSVNFVAPGAVTNQQFAACLASVLHRPSLISLPRFAMRVVVGEMADALLFASSRVKPDRLLQSGFTFKHPELPGAIHAALAGLP